MQRSLSSQLLVESLGLPANDLANWVNRLSVHDWEALTQEACLHRLASVVYQRLAPLTAQSSVLEKAIEPLNTDYTVTGIHNLQRHGAIYHVLNALESGNAPVIVLKGAYLAQHVYQNLSLRPMIDLDVLVRGEDLPHAERCLLELGYKPYGDQTWHAQHHINFAYAAPPGGVTVELHWNIASSPFRVDVDGLWQRAKPVRIAGVPTLTLSPEDLVLHLCHHVGFHHLFSYHALRSLYDVAVTADVFRDQLAWEQLCQRAQQWGAANCTYLTLSLVERLFGAAVPETAFSCLQAPDFEPHFIAWAEERIFATVNDDKAPAEVQALLRDFERVWLTTRPTAQAAAYLRTWFPPPQRLAELYALPSSGFLDRMYYQIAHVRNLAKKHGRVLARAVARDQETAAWLRQLSRAAMLTAWLTPQSAA